MQINVNCSELLHWKHIVKHIVVASPVRSISLLYILPVVDLGSLGFIIQSFV
jgi:hypothetical protein